MLTLKQLHQEVRQRCDGYGLRADVVSGGLVHARYGIVSSYPGPAEARSGVPFSGGSGALLWDCLRGVGLTRNDFYTTNVIKSVVSVSDEVVSKTVHKHEFDLWCEVLRYELSQLPNIEHLFILGNEALRALTAHMGILQWRGSLVGVRVGDRDVRSLISVNPAMVLREQRIVTGEEHGVPRLRSAKRIFQFDCHKFKLLTQGKLSPYAITHHINPSYREAVDHLDHCAHHDGPVAFDIETLNGETACVGFATSPYEGTCINFIEPKDGGGFASRYGLGDEVDLRRRLQSLLANPDVRLVAQNGGYDTTWMWYKDRIRGTIWYDTLLAHHTLYPGLPHSLAFLTSRYTTHPYYKDEKEGWRQVGDADSFWRYNVKDCCITLAVQAATSVELEKTGLTSFFHSHVMRLQPHLARMTVGGILCDVEYKAVLNEMLESSLGDTLEGYYRAVARATGDPLYRPMPLSPVQVGELLFRRLKLVGRGTSTDEKNRERIVKHPRTSDAAREVVTLLGAYKDRHKFLSTYLRSEVDPDSRLRCDYKQFGTQKAPGRLSSTKTGWLTGMNLQNQPKEAYPMFVCQPGYSLFYFDLEQAEARVVGWLARIEHWIRDFEKARLEGGYDCHRALAAAMWGMAYDDTPESDYDKDGEHSLRYLAKRCRHGLNYRMAAQRLAETTGLSTAAATDAYNRYHRINPELRRWWDATEAEVRERGCLYNLYGRRWVLTEALSDVTLESIVAFKPQSTIGDKVNRVIYMAEDDEDWPRGQARIALNIHDAVVGIARSDLALDCLRVLKRHAEEPLLIPGMPPLIIPAALKMTTQGTKWRVLPDKTVEFYSDNEGFHRWSNLESVPLGSLV